MTTASPPPISIPAPRPHAENGRIALRKIFDFLIHAAALAGAIAAIAMLALLVIVLIRGSWPAIWEFRPGFLGGKGPAVWVNLLGWRFRIDFFLWSGAWDYRAGQFGAWPVIQGTIVSSLIAVLIAVPISVGTAIYLVRLAPRWMVKPVSFLVELLAAIPSITYGMWGMFVLVPFLQNYATPLLENTLGRLTWFTISPGYAIPGAWFQTRGGVPFHVFAAGVVLAIMITPIITAISRDVLAATPNELEQGAYGLGATWWQATKVVLGYSRMGIFGAVILGLGRALGETMAVTMVIGNRVETVGSVFQPGATIASLLANEFPNWDTNLQRQSLVYCGLILLVITMLINGSARVLIARFNKTGRI